MPKNLWGDLGSIKAERTPTTVLREQAAALGPLTKGVLRGNVETGQRYGRFSATLSIVAPAVNDYEFAVAEISYGINLYPVSLVADWEKNQRDSTVECEDEEALTAALEQILTSDRVRRVITSLIAQSNS